MSVMRFEPFRDPFRELDRLSSLFSGGGRASLGMPMDVYRTADGSYHVEVDLPGCDPESVEVTVDHGALTLHAERTADYGDDVEVIVAERPQGSFTRQLSLGEGVDTENLTAEYADGVLHVTIPSSPKTQPRKIEVSRGAGSGRSIQGAVESG
jgi:HSP20 family protein